MRAWYFGAIVLKLVVGLAGAPAGELAVQLRRPAALTISADSRWVYIANRDSGSISIFDATEEEVVGEVSVGNRLTDIALVGEQHIVAVDSGAHQVVLLEGQADDWTITSRCDVARHPQRVIVAPSHDRFFVASLWTRRLTECALRTDEFAKPKSIEPLRLLDLPFEPGEVCLLPSGQNLVVADAFGSSLAVVSLPEWKLVHTCQILGHNIGGLSINTDQRQLWISHQELNPLGRATQDDVHWGNVISNRLTIIPIRDLMRPRRDSVESHRSILLGAPGRGAGDPGRIAVIAHGEVAIALSGVNEIGFMVRLDPDSKLHRMKIGKRPVDLSWASDGRLFVLSMFSDSISVIGKRGQEIPREYALGPPPKLHPAEIGEMLFFDSSLSHDGWMSCHSCHTFGHTNSQLNDNLSDGSFGAPKRVLSLFGVAETGPWAWSGDVARLEDQVANSIQHTMQGEAPTSDQIVAITAFLKRLPTGTLPQAGSSNDSKDVREGRNLFNSLSCNRCHRRPTYTSPDRYNVNIVDEVGNSKFNPPSLRGVGMRRLFFHDGRASSLESVVREQKHQLPRELSDQECEQLLKFLRSL